jgi:D-glycerate 3-kinase
LHAPLAERLVAKARAGAAPLVAGVTGPQGSGKTTAAMVLERLARAEGLRTATLSLDDLYLPRGERLRLAREVHPLLATRGPPGTHDVGLGIELLARLGRPGIVAAPSFDKGTDDRRPMREWKTLEGPFDLVLFEGWCVGARAQAPEDLAAPVNDLERQEDRDGVWRRFVNDSLAGPYQALFAPIGHQLLFLAPDFATVLRWRLEQESKLRAARPGAGQSDAEVARFVQFYERLTRHIAAEMPARADVVVRLDADRSPVSIEGATRRSTSR